MEKEEILLTDKKLTPAQYWEWKFRIEGLKNSRLQLSFDQLKATDLLKDIEILKYKQQISKKVYEDSKLELNQIEKDYEDFRLKLSEMVGMDLKNCLIDEITYEIKVVNKE